MIDDVRDMVELYSSNLQAEHSRLDRHQPEFDLALWLYMLFALRMEKSMIGASRHLLYIGRKP